MSTFTIEQIERYILSQDSMGDILYNLNTENIINANKLKCSDCDEALTEEEEKMGDICDICFDPN